MVINYLKFPILQALEQETFNEKCRIGTFDLQADKEAFMGTYLALVNGWSDFAEDVRGNITFISKQYYECMKRSWKSFRNIDLREAISPTSGCLIFKSENGRYMALIYIVESISDMTIIGLYDCDTFLCVMGGAYPAFRCISTSDDGIYEGTTKESCMVGFSNILVCYLLMERYAKVETITCAGNSKIKGISIEDKKTINYTNLDLNFRDCTWFTSICRNEGFKVRGHFRLQPKKNDKGEWTKELIYINEFEKHGYHRQAKILTEINS